MPNKQTKKQVLHYTLVSASFSSCYGCQVWVGSTRVGGPCRRQSTYQGVFGTVRTDAYRRYIRPVLPLPNHFGKFGTISIPVPDTSASSVRHQYRYRTLRQVRYDISTGTENTGTVPNTPLKTYVFKAVCDPSTARYYVPGTGLHDVMKDIRSGIRLVDTCYTLLLRVHLHIF